MNGHFLACLISKFIWSCQTYNCEKNKPSVPTVILFLAIYVDPYWVFLPWPYSYSKFSILPLCTQPMTDGPTCWWIGQQAHTHAHRLFFHCLDAKPMCKPSSHPSITVNLATEASQLLLSKIWALLFHPQYSNLLLLQGRGCTSPSLSTFSAHKHSLTTHTRTQKHTLHFDPSQ